MKEIKGRVECSFIEIYNCYFTTVYFDDEIVVRIPSGNKEEAIHMANEYMHYLKEGMN